jgi:protein TIF31
MYKELVQQKFQQCFESIQYSTFNPVPSNRKIQGDLFYLTVKTLDKGERGVTCCTKGFYANNNVEKGTFNPGPNAQNSCFSYSLIGCLNLMSPVFGKNIEKYINQLLETDSYFLTEPSMKVRHWASFSQPAKHSPATQGQMSEVVTPLYGMDPRGVREWNEEYQTVKEFPKDNMPQRIQRDRALNKIYNDFLTAAQEGAMAIVHGNIAPLNVAENKNQRVFVYNQIFFSFAVDLHTSFRDLVGLENNPSWTQANHDITGLKSLQFMEISGLHQLATALINYRGHRVIAQSIIPGILNNSDLFQLAEYGIVEESGPIKTTPESHAMITEMCQKLNIQVQKVIDAKGNEVEIAGCAEIKGIRGTDKRRYFVDVQGVTPRDANYLGPDNHTCLLRQEMLHLYNRHQQVEHAKVKLAEFDKEHTAEFKEKCPKVEEGKEMSTEDQQKVITLKRELYQKRVEAHDKFMSEIKPVVYNHNVFKRIKLAMSDEEIKAEEKKLLDVATYIKEKGLSDLVQNLCKNEGMPTDSNSLREFFHQNGINLRYLGQVANIVAEKENFG